MMDRVAFFAGSFDPFTVGHERIVRRALSLFDKIVVGVGVNDDKVCMFSPENRVERIRSVFTGESRVEVVCYEGLTVNCCRKVGAKFLVRGIRDANDLEYERRVAEVNKSLDASIETVFFLAENEMKSVSSTAVRRALSGIEK